jgi:lipoprotein-releasing system ATP-binding protein
MSKVDPIVHTTSHQDVLRLEAIKKSYNVGLPTETEVLHGIDLAITGVDFAALIGPSGSGKSTLLNLIGLLDQPTLGELYLLGQATRELADEQRTLLRRESIGFVFQFHHLIEAFSAVDNIMMPVMVKSGRPQAESREWAEHLLEAVGLAGMGNKAPSELSGGQQQRVAIARALMTRPALLLADEPTGNLDTHTAESIFKLLREFNSAFGCAVLIVTHDPRLSQTCDRSITLVDGKIVSDQISS